MNKETVNLRRNHELSGQPESMTHLLEQGPDPKVSLAFVSDMVRLTGSDYLLCQWQQHLNGGLPQLEAQIATAEYRQAQAASERLATELLHGKEFGWWDIETYRQRLLPTAELTSEGQFVAVLGGYALERVANAGSLMVPNHRDLFPEGENTVILDALTNATVTNWGNFPLHMVAACNFQRLCGGTLCAPYHPSVLMYQAEERLLNVMPMNREGAKVAWFNAGGDAVSVAIFAAEKYCTMVHGENGPRGPIAFREAYHCNIEGRAGEATDGICQSFHPEKRNSAILEYPNRSEEVEPVLAEINALIDSKKVSCIIFESTQGDGGGVSMHPDFFVQLVKTSLDKHIPLICDEVQSGFGRSGRLFDVEYLLDVWEKSEFVKSGAYPEKPPIIYALAKSLTGGVVSGSAVVLPKEYAVLKRAEGLNTYSAMPASLAAAIATTELMQPELLRMVSLRREAFDEAIAPFVSPNGPIREVRGHGLHLFTVVGNDRANEIIQAELLGRKRILVGTTARGTVRAHAGENAPIPVWQALGKCIGEVARDVADGKISEETRRILASGVSGLASR